MVEGYSATINYVVKKDILKNIIQWLRIMEDQGHDFPRTLDEFQESLENSKLLRRIIEGKMVFKEPPPTKFGHPNYEIIENSKYKPMDVFRCDNDQVIIDKHLWVIEKVFDSKNFLVRYKYQTKDGKKLSSTVWVLSKDYGDWVLELS